ncbi:MAG: SDR family oxidoreductase [Spirochaetales bacterium]|nr:SDR family oxidoreductase [Spirochaetales bacterium]
MKKQADNIDAFGLNGKTAVISGGAVNIGRAISRHLAGLGAKIVIIYNSSRGPADELAAEIEASGGTAASFKADISDDSQVCALFEKIAADRRFGGVDIMVNNSGIFSMSRQSELPSDEWQRIFDVNVKGLFLCCREAARRMQVKGESCGCRGSIVNIASINALHPGFGLTAHYDAAKGAVAAYTRSLAAELGPEGIRVNAVAPGLVDSESLREFSADLALTVEGRNPLRNSRGETRLVSADDVAKAVAFLASDMAGSITGEIIVVDRGYLLT